MKKHLLLLFAALLPLVASAQTKVEIGGIWYNLVSKAKQAEVTSSDGDQYSGSITLTATVTYEGVAYSVTSIGRSAFSGCTSLTAITIPEGVTSIGDYAFYVCRNLTAITIPEGVTSIGNYAFYDCSSLTAITIPESVTSIGYRAFDVCSSLTAIVVAKGNKVYDSRSDCNAIIETNSNTLIQGCATTIIPEGVTSIGECAFYGCSNLTAITIPEGVTSIGESAFYGCSSLTAITIPEGVTSIGNGAFYGCSGLTAITIPEGVTSIGECAFYGCSSLTAITIPEGVTRIRDGAFYGCSGLTAITIPEGVTSIGNYAFYDCSSLTAITIPESVTSIGDRAFFNCSGLTAITIPEGVTSIRDEAFYGCSGLTDVYCNAETVPSTEADAFDLSCIGNATLHVPASAMDEYKNTAPWSSFGTIKAIEHVVLEKCATPTISYVGGKIIFACDTEGATVKSNFIENIAGDYNDMEVALIPTYTLTAYATKENYENSDPVSLTICWVPCSEKHEEDNGILTIPAKPVLIQCQGGVITLSGLDEGTEVAVYTANGTLVATATATDGTATLTTNLTAGTIAIVKTGDYSIKVAIK